MEIENLLELGATAVVAIVALLGYQKLFTKPNGTNKAILTELKLQNENHLEHFKGEMVSCFNVLKEGQERQTDRLCQKLDLIIQGVSKLEGKLEK